MQEKRIFGANLFRCRSIALLRSFDAAWVRFPSGHAGSVTGSTVEKSRCAVVALVFFEGKIGPCEGVDALICFGMLWRPGFSGYGNNPDAVVVRYFD